VNDSSSRAVKQHHARRGQHREEQVESSDVSSNTKKRMPWSAISQCRLRRLRLQP
jgi:hypothetical protein